MLGSDQAAFDLTIAHLRQREQFGVVIGTFQALQHRAAGLYLELELGDSSYHRRVVAAARGL